MFSLHGLSLCVALVLNATANLLMKVGVMRIESEGGMMRDGAAAAAGKVLTSPVLLVGLACFGMNAVFYMFALQSKALKVSLAYPIMVGGGYAIIAAGGYLKLGERLDTSQKIGVAMILAGVIIVAART